MPVEVILPKVDMDMEKGTIAAWHVQPGGTVAEGDALFDIETDKAAMEVEAPGAGTLAHVIAPEGTEVAVGRPVAWIYGAGEEIPDAAPGALDGEVPSLSATPQPSNRQSDSAAEAHSGHEAPPDDAPARDPAPADTVGGGDLPRPRATPAARSAAREGRIDLDHLAGTGPRGRVQAADVAEALRRAPGPSDARSSAASPAGPWSDTPGPLAVSRRKGRGTAAPIVLIHGLTADANGWAPLEKALGGQHDVIRIDLPSHGRSPLKRVKGFADFARLVVEAFDGLDLPDGAHLVGHSLGGAVAATIADIRPRQCRSLTLISPAGLGPDIDGAAMNGILRATRSESLAPWLKRLAGHPDAISYDFAQTAMSARMDPGLRAAQADLAERLFPDGTQSFDLRDALGRIAVPLRILWGRRDTIIPWSHILRAPEIASLQILDGAGHIPHIEAPALCARAVRETIAAAGG